MAYLRMLKNGNWRAEVQKHGKRASRVFADKEEAEAWASGYEKTLEGGVRLFLDRPALPEAKSLVLLSAIPGRVLKALAEIPHDHYELQAASFPVGSGVGVYFLLLDNEVVYVGKTIDFIARLYRHSREKQKSFDAFAFIQCLECDLDALEAKYIDAFLPRHNRSTGSACERRSRA